MALYDSSDLLARCQRWLNRPASDLGMTDAHWYAFLTEAQSKWYNIIATRAPHVLYGAPELLTTADSGATYNFASSPFPGGAIEVRESRAGALLTVGAEFDDSVDFTFEGDKLRVPGGRRRTFSSGPYARYIAAPTVVAAATEPTLKPAAARMLMVYDACTRAAIRLGTHDPQQFREMEKIAAWGDPEVDGDVGLIGALRSQMFGGGQGADHWWLGLSATGYSTI